MRHFLFLFFYFLTAGQVFSQKPATPEQLYGELFRDVQTSGIFPDSKTFVDCVPKKDPKEIVAEYKAMKNNPAIRYSLQLFVEANFLIPQQAENNYATTEKNIVAHIQKLWPVLRRKSDSLTTWSSLLPLPYDYVVPGGRFREIYYWDSYFTMLGLRESKEFDLMENMVRNFAFLINQYGHVPNGNRSYYLSRSQPPFFSLMLDLLAQIKGNEIYVLYLPALEKEYNYWMDKTGKTQHVVKMPDGSFLNRYWDQLAVPREEAYLEDKKVAGQKKFYPEKEQQLFRDLRSAAESGWDFSSRWMKDGTLSSIQTTSFIAVDLNCLLYHLELTIAKGLELSGDKLQAAQYTKYATRRKTAINKYCWSATTGWYVDYNNSTKKQSASLTLAGMFPFFLKVADGNKFAKAKALLENKFLQPGGVITTLVSTAHQWDAPNGWAPLQWVTVMGLEHYGEKTLSKKIATRWCGLNQRVFETTGRLVEKYNVVDPGKAGGGGEYPSQDGFGWTNGVYLALINKYKL